MSNPACSTTPSIRPAETTDQDLGGGRQEHSTAGSLLLSVLVFCLAGHQQCMYFIFMAFVLLLLAAPEGTQDAIYLEESHLKNNLMHIP